MPVASSVGFRIIINKSCFFCRKRLRWQSHHLHVLIAFTWFFRETNNCRETKITHLLQEVITVCIRGKNRNINLKSYLRKSCFLDHSKSSWCLGPQVIFPKFGENEQTWSVYMSVYYIKSLIIKYNIQSYKIILCYLTKTIRSNYLAL